MDTTLDSVGVTKDVEPLTDGVKKTTYQLWYLANKERLSQIRKDKYYNNPEYREKLRKQSSIYRKCKPTSIRKKSKKITILKLCELAGCSIHTYRKYSLLKWIPTLPKGVYFNETHISLLKDLCDAAIASKYLRNERLAYLAPYITAIQQGWGNVSGAEIIVDNI